jgi:hypothetical protein
MKLSPILSSKRYYQILIVGCRCLKHYIFYFVINTPTVGKLWPSTRWRGRRANYTLARVAWLRYYLHAISAAKRRLCRTERGRGGSRAEAKPTPTLACAGGIGFGNPCC